MRSTRPIDPPHSLTVKRPSTKGFNISTYFHSGIEFGRSVVVVVGVGLGPERGLRGGK
jgi:hypothetical protein